MRRKIIIGTRSSKLALWQAEFIKARLEELYPEIQVVLKHISTKGDRILDVPLAKIGGKGLFTKELEVEILDGTIDMAVHSLKDMPTVLPDGLEISTITERFSVNDALVSDYYTSLEQLPPHAIVGTSSLRRKAQLLHYRPDLEMRDLRGNVNTRLQKLHNGEYDAIILASAGLKRLGFHTEIKQEIPTEIILPAVGQGALAIEIRLDNEELRQLLAPLHDWSTYYAVTAERAFLTTIEGGCQVPVGVYAFLEATKLFVEAVIASVDGDILLRDSIVGNCDEAMDLGITLANKLLNAGGREILQEIGLCND